MSASTVLDRAPIARWSSGPSRIQLTLGLVIVALAVRMMGLNDRPLWLDEAYSGWFASHDWHYLWTVVPTYEPHPPFYYSILKIWSLGFGKTPLAVRSLSVLFGIAAVPITIAAAFEREQLSPSKSPLLSAGMAGFLVACLPMLVGLDQEARPYPFLVFAYSMSIFATFRLVQQFARGECGEWSSWIILGIGTELTLWAHALGVLYAFCLAMALGPAWLKAANKARLCRGALIALFTIGLYVPWLIMMVGRTRDWGANWLAWKPSMLLQLVTFYSVAQVTNLASIVALVLVLLLAKRAVQQAFQKRCWNADVMLLILWLGPPFLSAAVSALVVPIFLPRTLAGTLVPASLAIGAALARTPSPRERVLLTTAVCLTMFPSTLEAALRPPFERWDLVASYLSRNVSAGDQIWLYPSDSALPLRAAGSRLNALVRPLPAPFPTLNVTGPVRAGWRAMVSLSKSDADRIAADRALEGVGKIWLVTRQSGIFDPANDLPNALGRVRKAGPAEEWGYISVQAFTLRQPRGPVPQTSDKER